MSVISITFAQCDGIEQKLRDAGVIETVDLLSIGLRCRFRHHAKA